MWAKFANLLLRKKIIFAVSTLLLTFYLGYEAFQVKLSYEFAKILPESDSTYLEYQKFKKHFGEDGNVMVIGFNDPNLFKIKKLNDLAQLNFDIKNIDGIKDVLSITSVIKPIRNDSLTTFQFEKIFPEPLQTESELQTFRAELNQLPFYEGFVLNSNRNAYLIAISFNKKALDSEKRISIVKKIKELADRFSEKNKLQLHYSGMPFIRSEYMSRVSGEMTMFMVLAMVVTLVILWLFFRSVKIVVFSLLVVLTGMLWTVGIMNLFEYKITILTGLIPPLIIVIGIPNCVFLINKFQSNYIKYANKTEAIVNSVETIGITLFLANITTSIGFAVLYFTGSLLLMEFGVIAAIGVMVTYFISLILVPIVLYFLPPPREKHTKHLNRKTINFLLAFVNYLVHKRRKLIYYTTILLTAVFAYGMNKIDIIGFVVDDLPKKDPIYTDLNFFETNFNGVLPFEVVIDTKKENGVFSDNARTLYKIKAFQKALSNYPELSKPISLVEVIKFSYQAYKNGDPKYFRLPSISELKNLSDYTASLQKQNNRIQNFLDDKKQITRISYHIKDIGSQKMSALMNDIRPMADSIFNKNDYKVNFTGHSLVFLKNNDYLLSNLLESLLIEIILITLVGITLFRSVRIILFSKIPCLIPLVITAGIMGFFNVQFKPSTILIFSIAFGISSDGTIYFLTKFRQELQKYNNASLAIGAAIKETGFSMIYSTVILFFGFIIFAASGFGGTVAMGLLVSLTLLMSLFTNLILLPCILTSIYKRKQLAHK